MRRRKNQQSEGSRAGLALSDPMMDFSSEGSWYERKPDDPRDPANCRTYDAVRSMVMTRRRNPDLLPEDFVEMIHAARVEKAFPWSTEARRKKQGSWIGCRNWIEAFAGTAAERCVKTGCREVVPNPIGIVGESAAARAFLALMGLEAPPAAPAAPISPGPELPPAPEQSPATGEPGALDAWELEA